MKTRRSLDFPLPGLEGALAEDVGGLLERLEVPALICNGKGELLFATKGADAALARRGVIGMQSLRVCLGDVTLCVTSEGARGDSLDLTPRHRAVLALIAEGLDNTAMSARLGISVHTVRRHVEGLLSRLRVKSRQDAEMLLRHHANAVARCGATAPMLVA
ncbi:MAG: helix-turn-helix transcriptional regulator [Gemmatimonadaceae bacterium]|nr:helix-turn-helix transcriptional regulator [Gemmatimonadaceae bacterium]